MATVRLAGGMVGRPSVLVELTYMEDGTPIALCRGKIRERGADMETLKAWLSGMKDQIAPPSSVTTVADQT